VVTPEMQIAKLSSSDFVSFENIFRRRMDDGIRKPDGNEYRQ